MTRAILISICLMMLNGCSENVHVLKFTDVGSRREYRSIGNPSVLPSGAVSFRDETSGKAVTLQSWEAEDDQGRYYIAKFDPIWGGYKLVESPASKKKAHEQPAVRPYGAPDRAYR